MLLLMYVKLCSEFVVICNVVLPNTQVKELMRGLLQL